MKGRFEAFFTTQNNRLSQIEVLHQSLLDSSTAPVDVPHKILKLLKVYHDMLEIDRNTLRKSLNGMFTFNPSDKQELIEIEEQFFKSDENKISEKINHIDVFKVATMPFPEGEHFYAYIKMRREVAAYCERVSAYLLQLKSTLQVTEMRYRVYDVYEKGSGGVLNAYWQDPIKEVRQLLKNMTGKEDDESLLKMFAELTRILSAGNENEKAAAFYLSQLNKIADLHFTQVVDNEESYMRTVEMK